jgi:hypothetical protein
MAPQMLLFRVYYMGLKVACITAHNYGGVHLFRELAVLLL